MVPTRCALDVACRGRLDVDGGGTITFDEMRRMLAFTALEAMMCARGFSPAQAAYVRAAGRTHAPPAAPTATARACGRARGGQRTHKDNKTSTADDDTTSVRADTDRHIR